MEIREERDTDFDAITEVTVAAFKTLPISNNTEQFIIHALRKAGVLTISLVAEIDGRVVGHVAFSPVTIADGSKNWHGLGPVSVLPVYHRQGIGRSLISRGLYLPKEMGGQGCVLVGDPNYYTFFGFRNYPQLVHEGVPQEVFIALPFTGKVPGGTVTFHKGFQATN